MDVTHRYTPLQTAEERLAAFDTIDASLGQKTEELKRVTASREKLVQMVKSLQACNDM